jgi:hypothetical protein
MEAVSGGKFKMSTGTKDPQPVGAPREDWFLQVLVNITDKDQEFGITLLCGGFLVSGTLVSEPKFFEGFATDFASAFPEADKAHVKRTMMVPGEVAKTATAEGDGPLPGYIHLKDAKFFHPSGTPIPGNRGVWWRGRLAEVSGFTLGDLNPPKR